jgi:hypothetical protein
MVEKHQQKRRREGGGGEGGGEKANQISSIHLVSHIYSSRDRRINRNNIYGNYVW